MKFPRLRICPHSTLRPLRHLHAEGLSSTLGKSEGISASPAHISLWQFHSSLLFAKGLKGLIDTVLLETGNLLTYRKSGWSEFRSHQDSLHLLDKGSQKCLCVRVFFRPPLSIKGRKCNYFLKKILEMCVFLV